MNLYKIRFFALLILPLLFASCDKMEDRYMEYTKGGEIIYLGKADSVKVFSGRNRIKVSWLLLSDPKITKSVIYWNEKKDSAIVNVQRSKGTDTISVLLGNMLEKSYSFEVYNFDNKGNSSVKTEAIGIVYGDRYASVLTNRVFESTLYKAADKSLEIKWFGASDQVAVVEMKYIDLNGIEKTVKNYKIPNIVNPRIPPALAASTLFPSFKIGTTFKYRTGYIPKAAAIDTFYTDFKLVTP